MRRKLIVQMLRLSWHRFYRRVELLDNPANLHWEVVMKRMDLEEASCTLFRYHEYQEFSSRTMLFELNGIPTPERFEQSPLQGCEVDDSLPGLNIISDNSNSIMNFREVKLPQIK